MKSEDRLEVAAVEYGLSSGAAGRAFSHLEIHAKVCKLAGESIEPAAVYRWLMATGRFDQDKITRYLRLR